MAFMAVIMGLGLLFYMLLGFRYSLLGGEARTCAAQTSNPCVGSSVARTGV